MDQTNKRKRTTVEQERRRSTRTIKKPNFYQEHDEEEEEEKVTKKRRRTQKKKEKETKKEGNIDEMKKDEDKKEENKKKEEKKERKEKKEKKTKEKKVPISELKENQILHFGQYGKVVKPCTMVNGKWEFQFQELRADTILTWNVSTGPEFLCTTSNYFNRTEKCTKTELAQKLMKCGKDVFTVTFKPVLSVDLLAEQLQKVDEEADKKKWAKKLMDCETKKISGRLIKANNELGYSLIDDLGNTEPGQEKETRYRNVNHRDILELIHNQVRYILKK